MSTVKANRPGTRNSTALLLALLMALATVPVFAAPPAQHQGVGTVSQEAPLFDWSFLEILVDLFFGAPDSVQTIHGSSAGFKDPDGQQISVLGFNGIGKVSHVERGMER